MYTQQQLVVNLYDCALHLFNGFDNTCSSSQISSHSSPSSSLRRAITVSVRSVCGRAVLQEIEPLRNPKRVPNEEFYMAGSCCVCQVYYGSLLDAPGSTIDANFPFYFLFGFLSLFLHCCKKKTRKIEATTCESNTPFENLASCLWRQHFKASKIRSQFEG